MEKINMSYAMGALSTDITRLSEEKAMAVAGQMTMQEEIKKLVLENDETKRKN
ncbi:hypothetical protein [Thalassobacillus sp. C254]|uniref:hypothetical protein n=1 Tax=Thalassobacillus sp. C254 TaxID=1225341 RepID=UPI0012ECCDEE|nr:hypothetical protein [Thalassobacillus sp. C254]